MATDFLHFLIATVWNGITLLTGAVALVVEALKRFCEWEVPNRWYLYLVLVSLFLGTFQAWREEHAKVESYKSQTVTYQPEKPVIEGLRFFQKRVSSSKTEVPYGLEVTIQTDVEISPTELTIECDGPITEVSRPRLSSWVTRMDGLRQELRKATPNVFVISFVSPPFSPQTPLLITLFSKEAITVKKISRVS